MVSFRAYNGVGSRVDNRVTSVDRAIVIVSSAGGSLSGVMLANYQGSPVWLVLLAITGSLFFGLISSSARPETKEERVRAIWRNIFNAGALWTVACAVVWAMDLKFSMAMVVALVLGLFGTQFLEVMEQSMVPKLLVTKLAKWWLGGD